MKAMKFRVLSEEDSKRIQTALFKEGYAWKLTHKNFMHTNEPYLVAGGFGEDDNCITYIGNDFEYFNQFKADEYVLTPQGKFVKIAEYYKQPETKLSQYGKEFLAKYEPPTGNWFQQLFTVETAEQIIAKQKAVADKILDKLFPIDPFAICAGGAPRDWHFGNAATDLDIFFRTTVPQLTIVEEMLKHVGIVPDGIRHAEGLPEWYQLNPNLNCVYECTVDGVSVQLMFMKDITHRSVVPEFPFSICKAWYKHGKITLEREFKKCERHKIVVQTNKLYSDEHKYVQKMKNKFPDWEFFDSWEAAYKYVFENGSV